MGGRLGGLRDSLTGRAGEPRVITVLGMHRSGTSSLVGSLEEAGLPLGDVRSVGGDSNQKGHREPGELIKLHDDVLITSGGAWHLPPASVAWTPKQQKRRDEFMVTRAGMPLWGWKEPRTLLVIDGWLEVLPELGMVGTFRHPAVVARSLQRRHGNQTPAMWLDVWLAYNASLLRLAEDRAVPLIDFDLPAEQYQSRLRAIIDELDLQAPGPESEFFEASLRTSQQQAPPDLPIPAEVERVYERLVAIAASQASR
jgi:hypothetical protein